MNEDDLQALISGGSFMKRGDEDMGEGDYRDFLAKYMHAIANQADDEDLMRLGASVAPERRKAMLDYGGLNAERNPTYREHRGGLNALLRSLGGM